MTFALAAAAAGLIVAVSISLVIQWRRRPGRVQLIDNSWVDYLEALTTTTSRLRRAA